MRIACGCGCGGTPNPNRRFLAGHQSRGKLRWKPPAPTACKPTATDVAWAAGFYEGEGSVVAHRGTVTVSVSQKNREPLERLQRWFAGSIYKPRTNGVHSYHLSGGNARRFLNAVYPLLSVRRREQALRAGFQLFKEAE